MSKIVIVSGSYDPFPKANAVCAMAIERALKDKGHEVIYVVTRNNLTQNDLEIINGNKIFFIPKPISDVHWSLKRINESFFISKLEKTVIKYVHIAIKFLFRLIAFFKGSTSRNRAIDIYKENFIKVMSGLLIKEKPDCVLSFSVPFNSHLYTHESIVKSKHRPIWNCFLLDPHRQKSEITQKEKLEFKKEEELVFSFSDKVFLLNSLKESYNIKEYLDFRSKMRYFHLPFFNIPFKANFNSELGIVKSKDFIDFTFAGTIYDDIRSISFLTSFIEECKGMNIRFHLMGKFYPKSLSLLKKLQIKIPNQIILYGFMNRNFVINTLNKSDILINIGNDNLNQIPSKILEYIGMCKPILSFIKSNSDTSLEYLSRYPFSFVINEEEDVINKDLLDRIFTFYNYCNNKSTDVSKIRSLFKGYLEEEVTQDIVKKIEKQLDER